MESTYLNPSPAQGLAFRDLPPEGPLVMVNLLRFDPEKDENGLSGKERYAGYMREVAPFLEAAGGKMIWKGKLLASMIGPEQGEDWDEMLLVEYPSKAAFWEMASHPDFPSELRNNALSDSRLWVCAQSFPT